MTDDLALLNKKDILIYNPYFPEFEIPFHLGVRCDVNINGKITKPATIIVSPNLISAFKLKGSEKVTPIKTFYISDIKHLYYLPDSVRVKFEKDNLQIEISDSKQAALKLTQVLYRNYTLFYYKFGKKYELEVSSNKGTDNFPEIKLDISPSQCFQFYFSSQCAKCQVMYRHDVCRYMHNLIITNNPIFDFSQIPVKALTGSNSVLIPLIKSIQMTKFIRGICWENYSYPDLLNQLSPLFGNEEKAEGIRMIHLVNCNLTGDLTKVIKTIDDSSERRACFVSYWNLSNNPNLSFENFSHILDLTLSKIIFLSISNCNIDEKVAKEIFLSLTKNPNAFEIRHLEIGGVSLVGKSLVAFDKFLKTLNSRNTNKINLLDISSCDNLSPVLELVSKELPNLEILNVSHNKFTSDDFLLLTNYISRSKKLREIDLSRTKLSAEKIADIIKTFSKNNQLQNVTLKLNDLKLCSEELLPLFRVFLSQKETCDKKWQSIHLDSNGIDKEDLLTLTSLFKKFPNLETLSLSHNFDLNNEENKNIGDALVKLLSIPSLKNLSLAGDKDHRLGVELIQFLQAKNNNLEKIDISGNKISDSGFAEAVKLIKRSEKLKNISLCNNGMKNKNALNDLLSALKNSKNFPTVKFPLFETIKNSEKNDKNDKSEVTPESLIEDQKQVEISELFMRKRRKEGQTVDLPFECGDSSINEFVNELSTEFEKNFENQKRFTHSCICMKIHLPLPFQRTTETATGMRKEVDIGEMSVYQTDTMNYIITEQCPEGVKNDKVEEDKAKEKGGKKDKEKDKKDKEKGKKNKDKDKNKGKNSEDDNVDSSQDKNKEEYSDYDSEQQDSKNKKNRNKHKVKDSEDDSYSEQQQNKHKHKHKNIESNSYEDSDSRETKNRKKEKRRKTSDYSNEDVNSNKKGKNTQRNKNKKLVVSVSSDESDSEEKIDTRNIVYNLQTVSKGQNRKQTVDNKQKKPVRRKTQNESENESYSEEDNRNYYNKDRNRNKNHRRRKTEYSDDEEADRHRYKRSKYDDDNDDIDDEDEDIRRPTNYHRNKNRNKNKYDINSDSDGRDFHNYDDDYEDDTYSPNVKRKIPPPKFNDGNNRDARNRARLKDQPVKKRIRESNPQLDGTLIDPYYRKKNVPITNV